MAYDKVCKRLAADYPSALVHWLLAVDTVDIEKLPTELSLEPICSDAVRSQLQQLPVAQLEELGEALLDFSSVQDLLTWLQSR